MAFHDPIDAVSWALEVQHKLLLLPWPQQLLTQTDAKEEFSPESLSKQALLFKGLRVRMAMHTGLPDALQVLPLLRCCAGPKSYASNGYAYWGCWSCIGSPLLGRTEGSRGFALQGHA